MNSKARWVTVNHPSPQSNIPYSKADLPITGESVEIITDNETRHTGELLDTELQDLFRVKSETKAFTHLNSREVQRWRYV